MCFNCGYAKDNRPNDCPECKVCFRNPRNASRRLKDLEYRGARLKAPIDMYISKEHLEFVRQAIEEAYQNGMRARTTVYSSTTYPTYTTSSTW